MKMINFINPASPQTTQSCTRWFRISLLLILALCAFLTYMQVSQLMTWLCYRQKYTQLLSATKLYTKITAEKVKLSAQEKVLKEKIQILTNARSQTCLRIEQLKALYKAVTQDIELSSCILAGESIHIIINCPSIDHAQTFIHTLNQSKQFGELNMTSINGSKKTLNVALKSILKNP